MKKIILILLIILNSILIGQTKDTLGASGIIKFPPSKIDNKAELPSYPFMEDCDINMVLEIDTEFLKFNYDSETDLIDLTGRLFDLADSLAMIGATINCVGSSIESVADVNGIYKLKFKYSEIDSLELKYVGYDKKVVSVFEKLKELLTKNKVK